MNPSHVANAYRIGSMEFRLLGPVEAVIDGKPVKTATRQKMVLAALLLEANHVVPLPRLIDAVWGSDPPRTARTQVQITVCALRQMIGDDTFVTHPAGYQIMVAPGAVDLAQFEELVKRATVAAEHAPEAARHLRAALALWQGPALAGLESMLLTAAANRLNERRVAVLQDVMDVELQLGRHDLLISELTELVAEHPLNERFRGQLMLALYRAGRQADALETLRTGRNLLREELGLDPGAELRRLERAILTGDPQLGQLGPQQSAGRRGNAVPVPHQLPRTISDFAGRVEQLAEIGRMLVDRDQRAAQPDVRIVVLTGREGSGKTTLAIRAAHLLRPAFPDGQLFIQLGADLRQSTSSMLEHLLRTVGIDPDSIPGDLDGRSAMYRSWLADRRVLIVIDGAVTANQARHFLPGTSGCAVIITAIQQLANFEGAHEIKVGPLDNEAAVSLLTGLIGTTRVQAEEQAVGELIRLCEALPLALRIVGAKVAARPYWRISDLTGKLQDEERRLDELDLGGASVRASLAMAYDSLEENARRLFRRLSPFAAYDFAAWICGPLLDEDTGRAEDLLQQLVQSHLVETIVAEDYCVRYRMHDLVRLYAMERLAGEEPVTSRRTSVQRLLSCWLSLTTHAHRRVYGGDFAILHGTAEHWELPARIIDSLLDNPSASAWLRRERLSLVAAIDQAGRLGLDELCWDLAVTSATLFESGFYSDDWRGSHENALAAVRRAANKRGEAALLHSLGTLELSVRMDTARQHLRRSLEIFEEINDIQGQALSVTGLAFADRLDGDYVTALAESQRALAGFAAAGDLASQAYTLKTMAQIHADWLDFDSAERLLENSSAICAELRSPRLIAQIRHQLAELYLRQGRPEDAARAFTSVLHETRASGDLIGQMYALAGLGDSRRRLGDLAGAESALGEALALAGDADERLIRGRVLLALAEVDMARDRGNVALARIDEAIGAMRQLGAARIWQARALELVGRLHAHAGRVSLAEQVWHSAAEMIGTADPALAGQLKENLARLCGHG